MRNLNVKRSTEYMILGYMVVTGYMGEHRNVVYSLNTVTIYSLPSISRP